MVVVSIVLLSVCYGTCHRFAMRLPSLCRPNCPRIASLVANLLASIQLPLDALVEPVAVADLEEPADAFPHAFPFPRLRSADAGKLPVIINQRPALAPIGEDQQQVGSMLSGSQMHGVGEVVADIDWHPRIRPRARHAGPSILQGSCPALIDCSGSKPF